MKYIFIVLLLFLQAPCFAQCDIFSQYSTRYASKQDGISPKSSTKIINVNFFANENIENIDDIALAEQNAKDNNKTLLLIFTADWCKYCVPLKQQVQSNIEIVNQKFVVCYVDFDKNKDLAAKYSVRSLPASVFIKDNGERKTILGFSSFLTYRKHLGL